MAVDLAKLVVSLEADSRKYMEGMNRAQTRLEKFQREQTKSMNFMASGFKAFGASIAASLSVAAFGAFIEKLDRLQESAKAAGVGAEAFQAWGFAARKAGIDATAFASGMSRANKVIGDAASKAGPARDMFARLGVSFLDIKGNVRSTESVVLDFADAIAKFDSPAQRAAASAQLFGRELGPKFVAVLEGGSQGLKSITAEAQKLGIVIDEKTLKSADEFNDTMGTLASVSLAAVAGALSGLIPIFTRMASGIVAASTATAGLIKNIKELPQENLTQLFPFLGALSSKASGRGATGSFSKNAGATGSFGSEEIAAAPPGLTSEQFAAAKERDKEEEARQQRQAELFHEHLEERRSMQDVYDKGVAAKQEAQTKSFKLQMDRWVEDAKKAYEAAQQQAEAFGDLFVENLVQASDGGFKSILESWERTIAQMILKAQASRLFEALFPKGFNSSAAGPGGWIGGIAKVLGFAGGGYPPAGVPVMVGERGPEMVTFGAGAHITPNHALGGVVVNQTNNIGQGVNAAQVFAAMNITKNQTIAEIRDMMGRGR